VHLPAFPLRVARVHAVEHLRPVLRFGPARPRVDLDDGVEVVLRAAQHPRQLEALEAGPGIRRGDLCLLPRLRIVRLLRQLPEGERVVHPRLLALELTDGALELALLLAERLGLLLVVPETGLSALALDQIHARALLLDVKATPAAHRGAG